MDSGNDFTNEVRTWMVDYILLFSDNLITNPWPKSVTIPANLC